jgi:hypothetical protein
LPILLWAISWNIESLVLDLKIKFAWTTLMVSEELPDIIKNWVMLGQSFPRFIKKVCIAKNARPAWTSSRTCGGNVTDMERNGVVFGT